MAANRVFINRFRCRLCNCLYNSQEHLHHHQDVYFMFMGLKKYQVIGDRCPFPVFSLCFVSFLSFIHSGHLYAANTFSLSVYSFCLHSWCFSGHREGFSVLRCLICDFSFVTSGPSSPSQDYTNIFLMFPFSTLRYLLNVFLSF